MAGGKAQATGSFPGDIAGTAYQPKMPWNWPARTRAAFRLPSPLLPIAFATLLPFTCWNPEPMSARFSCLTRPPQPRHHSPIPADRHQQGVLNSSPLDLLPHPVPVDPACSASAFLSATLMDRPKLEVADVFRRYGKPIANNMARRCPRGSGAS